MHKKQVCTLLKRTETKIPHSCHKLHTVNAMMIIIIFIFNNHELKRYCTNLAGILKNNAIKLCSNSHKLSIALHLNIIYILLKEQAMQKIC